VEHLFAIRLLGAAHVDYVDTDHDRLQRAATAGASAIEGLPETKRGAYALTIEAGK